jgi:hypothetical protein
MWNERYSSDEYVFGKEPNTFLAEHVHLLEGPVLSIAEGEGRNAVFMAEQGLVVLGVDQSDVGLGKALVLAAEKQVAVQTEVVDLANYVPPPNRFRSVVSIFAHLKPTIRERLYPLIESCLLPDGIFLMEAYSKAQMDKDTGGPKDLGMLMSCEEIEREFPNLNVIMLREVERNVVEGSGHTGMASVVQFIGRKER